MQAAVNRKPLALSLSLSLFSCVLGLCLGSAQAQDWQKEWADTLNRAKGQELNLAVHSYEAHEAVAREFQKRFPDIKVNVTPATPSTFAPRIITEQRNGIFAWDAWWASTANMNNLVLPLGGFEKITDYMILPEVKDESNWNRPDMLYTSERGPYIFMASQNAESTAFLNKSVVKGLDFKSMDDLLNPKLKGLIATEDATKPNAGTYVLSSLVKLKGEGFMRQLLGDMKMTYISNQRQLSDSLMRGDSAVMIGGSPEYVAQCWNAGGCKDIVRLPVPKYLLGRGVGVLKNAPHKDATKVWINWLLSKEGQETYVKLWAVTNETGAVSMRKDVAPHPKHLESLPEFEHMQDVSRPSTDSGQKDLELVAKIYTEIRDKK
jgi:iron(III) transport system substrate-binding protein